MNNDLDIFVDEDDLFPIVIHYRVVRDEDGRKVRVEASPKLGDGDDWKSITGNFSQPSSQAFGEVLEHATIINHIDFRPLLRTWDLRDGVLSRFMKSWDVKTGHFDEAGNPIFVPISQRAISDLHYDLSQLLFMEYMVRTGLSAELKAALRDEETLRLRARQQLLGDSNIPAPDFGDMMRGRSLPEDMESTPVPQGFPTIFSVDAAG